MHILSVKKICLCFMLITKIRFHWKAFIVYKNAENLKILTEIFRKKLIVSNVILTFLHHLKPKIFSAGNHVGRHRASPPFQNLQSRPWNRYSLKLTFAFIKLICTRSNTLDIVFFIKIFLLIFIALDFVFFWKVNIYILSQSTGIICSFKILLKS